MLKRIMICAAALTLLVGCADKGKTISTKTENKPAKTEAKTPSVRENPKEEVKPEPEPAKPLTAAEGKSKSTITTKIADGTTLTADLYPVGDANAPIIFLWHQAGASRGEYLRIAPRLNMLGYNCLALDARSGRGGGGVWGDVENETAKQFQGMQSYWSAKGDLEACFAWAKSLGFKGKTAIWGSSYSSALALVIAGEGTFKPACALSFAPGEYLRDHKGLVGTSVAKITIPTFITSPKRERMNYELFKKVAPKSVEMHLQDPGVHGSRALFMASDSEKTWDAVMAFLEKHLPTKSE